MGLKQIKFNTLITDPLILHVYLSIWQVMHAVKYNSKSLKSYAYKHLIDNRR